MATECSAAQDVDGSLDAGTQDPEDEAARVWVQAHHGVVALLRHVGEDPARDGLLDTPCRVLRAYSDMTSGYRDDPAKILATSFELHCDNMVVLRDIAFQSLCEHHMLPFVGVAHVAYLPTGNRVVGLSKLARLVHCFARRLQVQERLTTQVATALMQHTHADGAAVVVEATHSCMTMRGIRTEGARMVTSSMLGAFRDEPETRAEFMQVVRGRS